MAEGAWAARTLLDIDLADGLLTTWFFIQFDLFKMKLVRDWVQSHRPFCDTQRGMTILMNVLQTEYIKKGSRL